MRFFRPAPSAGCHVRLPEGVGSARPGTVGAASGHALPGPELRAATAPAEAGGVTGEDATSGRAFSDQVEGGQSLPTVMVRPDRTIRSKRLAAKGGPVRPDHDGREKPGHDGKERVASLNLIGKRSGRLSRLTRPYRVAGGFSRPEGNLLAFVPSCLSPSLGRLCPTRPTESDPISTFPPSQAAWEGGTKPVPGNRTKRPYNAENRYHIVSRPRTLSLRGFGLSFDASHRARRPLPDTGFDKGRRPRNQGAMLLFSNISDPCKRIWCDVSGHMR